MLDNLDIFWIIATQIFVFFHMLKQRQIRSTKREKNASNAQSACDFDVKER